MNPSFPNSVDTTVPLTAASSLPLLPSLPAIPSFGGVNLEMAEHGIYGGSQHMVEGMVAASSSQGMGMPETR